MTALNQATWPFYAFLLLLFLAYITGVGYYNFNLIISEQTMDQEQRYELNTVLESLLSMNNDDIENSSKKRAVLPAELFSEKASSDDTGFRTTEGHCYLSGLPAMKDREYAYVLRSIDNRPLSTEDRLGAEAAECLDYPYNSISNQGILVTSPVLLSRDGKEPLPATVGVYRVQ